MEHSDFDPIIFPLGMMSKVTHSIPMLEVTLEASGFQVRESLDLTKQYIYPLMDVPLQTQWSAIWENCLDFDVLKRPLDGILSLARDPLMMCHLLLQRAIDPELPVRCCLITKYPT